MAGSAAIIRGEGRASSSAVRAKPASSSPPIICARVWWYFVTSQPQKSVRRGPGSK